MKSNIAICVGDLNGVGLQIALQNHKKVKKICNPIYCINNKLLKKGSKLLNIEIPKDFNLFETKGDFEIKPSKVSKKSGKFSYDSFIDAITLTKNKITSAIVTLPINKEAWNKANINFKGHTEVLRKHFNKNAIMMLGCEKMFIGLFTEHIALKDVSKNITKKKLTTFLYDFYKNIKKDNIQVLGLNPHAGDNGVLGKEEFIISKAIKKVNKMFNKNIFKGPISPDTAFSKINRKKYKYFVCMYHDQGLPSLKALYFYDSINVSLNLPIIRTSVDHGTAFDIAYKNKDINSKSYINAIKEAIVLINSRK